MGISSPLLLALYPHSQLNRNRTKHYNFHFTKNALLMLYETKDRNCNDLLCSRNPSNVTTPRIKIPVSYPIVVPTLPSFSQKKDLNFENIQFKLCSCVPSPSRLSCWALHLHHQVMAALYYLGIHKLSIYFSECIPINGREPLWCGVAYLIICDGVKLDNSLWGGECFWP